MIRSVGIIGCGAVIQSSYTEALGKYDNIVVRYVYDLNKDLAIKVAKIFHAEVVEKHELLLKSDIIIIATPPSSHFELIKESLAQGKKIICEKPFVGTVKEAEDLIELARNKGAQLFVAHFRRYYPSVLLAQSLVESGVLGKISEIEVYEGGKFSWQTQSGYVYTDPYGGVLFDTGSHTIDMALFVSGLDKTQDFSVDIVDLSKDKLEPAHHVEAALKINAGTSKIDFKLKLSRRTILANKIRIKGENGHIDISVQLTNYVRLTGKNGKSTVLYSPNSYDYFYDCFASQFKEMFGDVENSIFSADRFRNLVNVLQVVSKD
ncbi:MAG: Gfo/Idh/MocA family oxidoreductase [Pedobacter sp.]|nr:MAG: Gfo/Idh/MocA family oxidoreductase [Pedobacter sp.]